jgi:DNA adenine methylase
MIQATAVPPRPALRWHGGKWRNAPWIVRHFPKHRAYCEPYGGAASVLLQKQRSYVEFYNDLDHKVVDLFRLLREPDEAAELIRLLDLSPFSREEFERAYEPTTNRIEAARRMIVRSFMGFGSDGTSGVYRTGFRSNVTSSGTAPASDWTSYPASLRLVAERFRGVVIENIPAIDLMARIDGPATLFYIDPPYLPSTRSKGNRRRGAGFHVYEHELTEQDHIALLTFLLEIEGMVVISGYPSALYDETLIGWRRVSKKAYADGARVRTEVIWINPAAVAAMEHGPLFA